MEGVYMQIGCTFARRRIELGYTQAEMVRKMQLLGLEMSNDTFCRMESGKTRITLPLFYILCCFYNIDPRTVLQSAMKAVGCM